MVCQRSVATTHALAAAARSTSNVTASWSEHRLNVDQHRVTKAALNQIEGGFLLLTRRGMAVALHRPSGHKRTRQQEKEGCIHVPIPPGLCPVHAAASVRCRRIAASGCLRQ